MGDGLKSSSSKALKSMLEKVTHSAVLGMLTGTLVTVSYTHLTLPTN